MKNLINIDVENGYPVSTEIFIHELSKQQYQQVSFYRGTTVIPLTGITVTATIVCNKCLVAEDIPISLSVGETNIVDFPLTSTNDYTILPGEMLVEFKLSKDGILIYPAVAMVVMVTPSIRDDAQVTPQSYGTVSEILQEVANARGNFNSLGARLDNSDNRFSNYDTKEKTSSARGSYFFTDDGRIFAQSYDTVITENSFNVELSELPTLYNVWIDKSVTNVMANSIENTAEHRVKAYYVEDSTMELPSSILSAQTSVYHGFRYKQHVNNILKSVSKNYSNVLTIDKAVKSAGISFLFDNNGRIFAQTVDTTIGANSFDLTIDLPAEYNAWFAKNVVNVATGALTNTSAHKLKHIYAENDDLSLVQFSEDWNVIHRGFYPTLLKHYIYNSIAENYGDITNINGDITNINGDITNINGDITNINGDITDINEALTELSTSTVSYTGMVPTASFDDLTLRGTIYEISKSGVGYYVWNIDTKQYRLSENGLEYRTKVNDVWGKWEYDEITQDILDELTDLKNKIERKVDYQITPNAISSVFDLNVLQYRLYYDTVGSSGVEYLSFVIENIATANKTQFRLSKNGVEWRKKVNGTWGTWGIAIPDEAITSGKIGQGEVKATNIDGGAITSGKIGQGEVKATNIDDGAVEFSKLGSNLVAKSNNGQAWAFADDVTIATTLLIKNWILNYTEDKAVNPSKVICFDTNKCVSAVASLLPTSTYTVAKSVYVPSNIDTIPDSVLTLFPNVKVYYVDNPSSAVHLETDVQTAVQNKQITIYYKGEFNLADLFATSQKNLNDRLTALESQVGGLINGDEVSY